MKIQSVAILGAGAVGSYIIWGLSKKDNIRLGVIAEGDRARRLKESGCAINGAVYRPEVWTPQEAQGVDLLVVALKYGSLPGALESIKTAVGSNTVVMSLMNGVDSEELSPYRWVQSICCIPSLRLHLTRKQTVTILTRMQHWV